MAETYGKAVEIRYNYGDAKSIFANHFTIQSNPQGEFLLSFYEVVPPLFLGNAEAQKQQIDALQAVDANCVARIVVTKDRLSELNRIIGEHFAAYVETAKQSRE